MDNHTISINQRVEKIKFNKDEIGLLIEEYKPFIASVVESCIGKYVRYGEDDELSIGLIAFEEAIKAYDSAKGNFLAFSRNVIKRRLIDYFRKENKHSRVISLVSNKSTSEAEDEEFDMSTIESIKLYSQRQDAESRRAEIEDLKEELNKWKISYFDVAKSSPKQEGTRKIYMQAVNAVVDSHDLLKIMKDKRYLPIAEIEKISRIPRKKLERGRNYIVAVVIIMTGDYQYIKSFIEWR